MLNDYMLLKQRLLHKQRLAEHMRQRRDGVSEDVSENISEDGKIQMVETRLYIGLNDAETKKQLFET